MELLRCVSNLDFLKNVMLFKHGVCSAHNLIRLDWQPLFTLPTLGALGEERDRSRERRKLRLKIMFLQKCLEGCSISWKKLCVLY